MDVVRQADGRATPAETKDAQLAAATHGLANFAIDSALTQSTWQRVDHLDSPDWDDLFRRGLDYLLHGLQRGEPSA